MRARALAVLLLLVGATAWAAPVQFSPSGGGSWELLDRVLVRVDDDVVTLSEVEAEMEFLRRTGQAKTGALTRHGVVNDLVRRKLMVAEAKKLRMVATPEAVQREVDGWLEGSGDPEGLLAALRALGLDRTALEFRAEQVLLWKAYVTLKRETTFVPESSVREFFKKQEQVYGDRPLDEVHDEIRNYLAFQKFQTEFNQWVDRQVSLGRVRIMEFPDEQTD